MTMRDVWRRKEAIARAKREAAETIADEDLGCITSIAAGPVDGKLLIDWLRAIAARANQPVPAFLRGDANVSRRGPWTVVIVEGAADGVVYRYSVSWCGDSGTCAATPITSRS
jgi:hypothetical protein